MNTGELVCFVVSPSGEVEYLPMTGDSMVNEGDDEYPSWTAPLTYATLSNAVGGLIEYVPFHHTHDGNNIIPLPCGRWGRLLELIVNEEGKLLGMSPNIVGATFANWGTNENASHNFFLVGPTIVVAEASEVPYDAEDFIQYVGASLPIEVYATYGADLASSMLSHRWREWSATHCPEDIGGGEEE